MTTPTIDNRKATERQFAYLLDLISTRPGAKTYVDTQLHANHVQHPRELSISEMSNVIGVVLDMPVTSVPAPREERRAGIYESQGAVFRVYLGQQSGKMLVKLVELPGVDQLFPEPSYRYLGSADKHLPADARRLPLEEVGRLGVASGTCLVCGRRLDDPESVDRGIGPVCAARY